VQKLTILGVAGGSGSGKTTFARKLHESLPQGTSAILAQDHYYIDQSHRFDGDGGAVNFDHPESLDFDLLRAHLDELKLNRTIQVPQYDFKTHTRLQTTHAFAPVKLVIVDGILLLSQKQIRDALTRSVFVDTPEQLRFERRLKRDVEERGRTREGVIKQYQNQVLPMHDLFVEPSKEFADHLVGTQEHFDELLEAMIKEYSQNP
jgi:uridine kinase